MSAEQLKTKADDPTERFMCEDCGALAAKGVLTNNDEGS